MTQKHNFHNIEASVLKEASKFNFKSCLVALSGGADSIATTFALKKVGLNVIALHCNFHLRGEESNRDMNFVKEFCSTHEIPLQTVDFDVEAYLKDKKGVSVEMACRELRHEWFRKKLKETLYQRIVTGHNADDNIETFFLNILRGSGTRGLKGMMADDGIIWRPLLQFHRDEILGYLESQGLKYVVDSTNLESDFRRNYLRNKIIPLLKEEWKGFDTAMDKTLENLGAENLIVEQHLDNILPHSPNTPLQVETIIKSPAPLLLIKRFVDYAGPYSTTAEEILAAIKAGKPHIRRWKLKKGIVFLRNGNLFVEMCHGEPCA